MTIEDQVNNIRKNLGYLDTSNKKVVNIGERLQVIEAVITKFSPKFDSKTGRRYFGITCTSREYGTLWLSTSKQEYVVGDAISFTATVKAGGVAIIFLSRPKITNHIKNWATKDLTNYDNSR